MKDDLLIFFLSFVIFIFLAGERKDKGQDNISKLSAHTSDLIK